MIAYQSQSTHIGPADGSLAAAWNRLAMDAPVHTRVLCGVIGAIGFAGLDAVPARWRALRTGVNGLAVVGALAAALAMLGLLFAGRVGIMRV
ncbi:MAG: hypothetical protein ABI601_15600 [bacterium]